ncbi:MAG: hypothetical protein ACYSTI_10200 [Planctomycetota bacterium]|jgi:hypothetical protein
MVMDHVFTVPKAKGVKAMRKIIKPSIIRSHIAENLGRWAFLIYVSHGSRKRGIDCFEKGISLGVRKGLNEIAAGSQVIS